MGVILFSANHRRVLGHRELPGAARQVGAQFGAENQRQILQSSQGGGIYVRL